MPEVGRLEAFRETPALLDDATAVLRRHADRLGGVFVYWFGGMTKVLVVSPIRRFCATSSRTITRTTRSPRSRSDAWDNSWVLDC